MDSGFVSLFSSIIYGPNLVNTPLMSVTCRSNLSIVINQTSFSKVLMDDIMITDNQAKGPTTGIILFSDIVTL